MVAGSSVSTAVAEHDDGGSQEGVADLDDLGHGTGQNLTNGEQEDVGDQAAQDDGVGHDTLLGEHGGAGLDAVQNEGGHQQSGNAVTGDTQSQHGDHSGTNNGVVGSLGSGDAFQAALTEVLRLLGNTASLVVAQELSDTAADAGHSAQNGSDDRGVQGGGHDADDLLLGQALVVDLGGILQSAVRQLELAHLLQHLSQSDQGDHGGQHVDAVLQDVQTEAETGDAGDGVKTDTGHQQTDGAGDQGLGQGAAGNAGDQGDAQNTHGEVLNRGKALGQLGDEGGAAQQQDSGEQTAESRSEQRGIQSLLNLALLGQRIAVEGGCDGGVGTGGVQGNGGNGATVHTADVNGQQQDDGGISRFKGVGQGQHQNDTQGNGQAGDTTDDHAQHQTEEDHGDVGHGKDHAYGLANHCKITHYSATSLQERNEGAGGQRDVEDLLEHQINQHSSHNSHDIGELLALADVEQSEGEADDGSHNVADVADQHGVDAHQGNQNDHGLLDVPVKLNHLFLLEHQRLDDQDGGADQNDGQENGGQNAGGGGTGIVTGQANLRLHHEEHEGGKSSKDNAGPQVGFNLKFHRRNFLSSSNQLQK